MKHRYFIKFLILVFCCLPFSLISQTTLSIPYTVTKVDTSLDPDKVYDFYTGQKIPEKDLRKLVKKNPKLHIYPYYDIYGKPVKHYVDQNGSGIRTKMSANTKPEEGKPIPNIEVRTIEKETINLKALKGKVVILRFEIESNTFRFKKDEIADYEQMINDSGRNSEIEAIIIFRSSKAEVLQGFNPKFSNFHAVSDGEGFQFMYNIDRFPSTYLIDKNGILVNKYYTPDKNELKRALDN